MNLDCQQVDDIIEANYFCKTIGLFLSTMVAYNKKQFYFFDNVKSNQNNKREKKIKVSIAADVYYELNCNEL